MKWQSEVALWAAAAGVGLAGGVGYKIWAQKKYGGAADGLLQEAREARKRGDAASTARALDSTLDLITSKGGMGSSKNRKSTAVVAAAAAEAHEDAARQCWDSTEKQRHLAAAETQWRQALRLQTGEERAVSLDRLASLAQSRGDGAAAAALYEGAVEALATPAQLQALGAGDAATISAPFELAGILHNCASNQVELGETLQAKQILGKATILCDHVSQPQKRADCTSRLSRLIHDIDEHHRANPPRPRPPLPALGENDPEAPNTEIPSH